MSGSTATKKIVVCGGNGFLGSRICKAASLRGWSVTSISRSGEPQWSTVTSSPEPPQWSKSVEWHKGDILKPATYNPVLEGADAVVHSMGILLEADYKGLLQGKEPIVGGLKKIFSSARSGGQNPLEQKEGEELKPQESGDKLTYELMNRDSAIALAREAAAKKVSTFAYISAAAGAPVLPTRYITTKREAESIIASQFPAMRSIFLRPSFLYDSSRSFTMPIAAFGGVASTVNSLLGGRLTWLMGAGVIKPLKADVVGEAVVEALAEPDLSGPIEVPDIESLATKAWRGNML